MPATCREEVGVEGEGGTRDGGGGEGRAGSVLFHTGPKSYNTCHVIRLRTNNPHE